MFPTKINKKKRRNFYKPVGKLVFNYFSGTVSFYRPQRSWGKVIFLHVSVILFTVGGGYPSMPCRFPGPHLRGNLRGLAREVSRPHTWGGPGCLLWGGGACSKGVPAPGGGVETPPPWRLLLRAVRILLECILVQWYFYGSNKTEKRHTLYFILGTINFFVPKHSLGVLR